MSGIRESMVSKKDVVPSKLEFTDYGEVKKVLITKTLDKYTVSMHRLPGSAETYT